MPERSGATPIVWDNRVFLKTNQGAPIWKKPIASGNYKINRQNIDVFVRFVTILNLWGITCVQSRQAKPFRSWPGWRLRRRGPNRTASAV